MRSLLPKWARLLVSEERLAAWEDYWQRASGAAFGAKDGLTVAYRKIAEGELLAGIEEYKLKNDELLDLIRDLYTCIDHQNDAAYVARTKAEAELLFTELRVKINPHHAQLTLLEDTHAKEGLHRGRAA